ncbi:hypothetical protein HMPREF1092_01665 [Clostridium thermobutyricum]|uniref:Uncharacterized protein n=1 Tax=Clostridium thermobutyricum TaxID=29372 RepID=N9WHQ7_9CLOT|nr:DUF4878 domain-containing protein [Clostridium thermobutyricum]ENZ02430.1 hypothetical protein HMPREF1092_01665 [Clostridium thermobutyricum]
MKNKIIIGVLIALGLVISFKIVDAGGNEESKAKQSVIDYFEAAKNSDIQKMLQLSNDSRVESDEEHRTFLEEILSEEGNLIEDYKIYNVEAIGDNVFKFRVSFKERNNNEHEGLNLLVLKNDGKYIIQSGVDI